MVETADLKAWLSHPSDCLLTGYDPAPGQGTKSLRFALREFMPQVNGRRVFSRYPDGYAMLPWPHYTYQFALQGADVYQKGDGSSLYTPGHHYDDFRAARGQLVHGFTGRELHNFNGQDQIAVRIVDDDGWINWIARRGAQTDKFVVKVWGKAISPGHLILKQPDKRDEDKPFPGPGNVVFTVKESSPQLRFVLANEARELDQAWYPHYAQLTSPSLRPHAVIEDEDPDLVGEGARAFAARLQIPAEPRRAAMFFDQMFDQIKEIVPPSDHPLQSPGGLESGIARENLGRVMQSEAKVATPQLPTVSVLRVVVASPGDVAKERGYVPKVLEELNRGVARDLNLRLEAWEWETDSFPAFHVKGPQGQIDDSMQIENAAIVIIIFWRRFGTPLADGQTGTEHELSRAYDAWRSTKRPDIMVYFNQQRHTPKDKTEADQWGAVLDFKSRFPREGLWRDYPNTRRFTEVLRRDLEQLVRERYGSKR
jgi:hypothetical protein